VFLLNDILSWTATDLTQWQRDAVRRLFQKQTLDQPDYDDLYAMLKSANGLPDPENHQPVPLAQEHLPAQMTTSAPIILRAMRDLKHVNRIADGQKLEFASSGITVIYGDNASGKSGYSRVLKQACRARDLSETVHPDAFDPQASASVPEAIFDIEISGHTSSLSWKRGVAPPEALSTIAVFDGRCARAYLDDEQDVAYLPYGLDIVESLGQRVLPALAQRLTADIAAINTDTTPFADLLGDTAVGKIIASLNAETDPQSISILATLEPTETERLVELNRALTENDPKAKAKALRLSAQRINGLIARMDAALAWVNTAAIEKLKSYDIEAEAAIKAEAVAAAGFRAGESLLPGTGEQLWKDLFESARRFSTEIAYPGKPFPHVGSNAQCPLCQQQLSHDAVKRMQRFEGFVKQDTAKVADEKRQQREEADRKLREASLSFWLDAATREELEQLEASLPPDQCQPQGPSAQDPQHSDGSSPGGPAPQRVALSLPTSVETGTRLKAAQAFEQQVEARRVWLLGAVKAHTWEAVPSINSDPRVGLKSLAEKLVSQAVDLEKAGDEQQKKVLETERRELQARANVSPRLNAVLDLIRRMHLKAILTKCKDDLKTKAISDKAKEFANQAVTEALKNALNAEFQALGVDRIKTKLNERVEHGKMKHKLVLDLPVTKKLNEILSEGEQRAIAIGSFLAELHLAGHRGGIVFDDPVSSLDHHRRKDVARRLVEEAKRRQVIVLTHDTVFLGELRDVIEQQKVNHVMSHLDWMSGSPGHVQNGLPWEHQSYKDRLDKHERSQRELVKTWPAYPNEENRTKMREEYNRLRATIERVIEDVVFNRVVQRYRDWIRVNNLAGVVGFTEAEYEEIKRLYEKCHDVVNAHDPSSVKNAPAPDANQLGQDIADLKAVVETIQARRKKVVNAGASVVSPGKLEAAQIAPPS